MAGSKVGVNIVSLHDEDVEKNYIKPMYFDILDKYTRYLEYITYLEFSHVRFVTPEDGREIGNHARKLGFIPWSIHSEHLNQGDRMEDYLAIQKHEAEVCAALGCQVMVCHLPNLLPYIDFQRDLDIIGRVADITRSHGLRLAVETCCYSTGERACLPDADLIIKIVETLNRPDVGINLDTGHCLIAQTEKNPEILEKMLSGEIKQNLSALVHRIGRKLFTTHLQDNFGMNDDHQAPGFGYIDWETLIPAIQKTGYQGPFMMELTGMGVKARRTVPQLRKYPLEKELIFAAGYLNFLLNQNHRLSRWYAPRLQGDGAGSPTRALNDSPIATVSQATAKAVTFML